MQVGWAGGAGCGNVTPAWLAALWAYVAAECESLEPFVACGVPIVPTTAGTLLSLVPASAAVVIDAAALEDADVKVSLGLYWEGGGARVKWHGS